MNLVARAIVVLAFGLSVLTSNAEENPATPAEQYAALLREYNPASGALRKADTDLQRKAAVERLGTFSARFVKLVEDNPQDPIALKVLRQAIQAVGSTDSAAQIVWETNRSNFPTADNDDSASRIVSLLLRDHLQSDKLGPICDRMRYGYRLEFESFLRTVLDKNPDRNVQAVACLSLAQFLNDKLRMLQLAEERPELAECYEIVFGKNYLPQLQRLGQDGLASKIETLFARAHEEYADVSIRAGVTVGARAKSELYDIRHLGVGKVALDIEGKDQEGKPFKLSDYRGKVVLLYFWSEY
jgi:hypothetical protein